MSNQEENQPHEFTNDYDSYLPVINEKKLTQPERIIEFMDEYRFPVSPVLIENKLGIPAKSASSVLCTLVKDGSIERISHGLYIRNPRYGVGRRYTVIGPRVQNLWVCAEGVGSVVSDSIVLYRPFTRVDLTFGEKRSKVCYHVSCSFGLGIVSLAWVHDLVKRECVGRGLVIPDLDWMATKWDWFTDVLDVSLVPDKSVTLIDFLGNMVKFYNKPRVRAEAVPCHPIRRDELQRLLGFDLEGFHDYREKNALRLQMASLQDTMKYFLRDFREARRDLIE